MIPASIELIARAKHNLQEQDFRGAALLLDEALVHEPKNRDLLQMAGVIQSIAGAHLRAIDLLKQVAEMTPGAPEAHANLARALWRAGRPADALRCHTRLDELGVQDLAMELDRATLLSELERFEEALASCTRATDQAPQYAGAWAARASALHELKRYEQALACFDRALSIDPAQTGAWVNKALTLHMLQRHDEALALQERALEVEPDNAKTWSNCGATLLRLGQHERALACCDKALALWPAHALPADGKFRFEGESVRPHRQYIATLFNRGNLLVTLKRHDEAMATYARLIELAPDADYALGAALFSFRTACDWRDDAAWLQQLEQASRDGKHAQQPFIAMMTMDDPGLQRAVAERYVSRHVEQREPLWTGERYRHARLHVAYLSADFRIHPTSRLLAGVLEHHDRSRIELSAIALGSHAADEMTDRIRHCVDHFVDAGKFDDRQIAQWVREHEVDVLVDLMGHSSDARPGVFPYRPAPVQATWLGYPGTTGLQSMDFLLADRLVIPPGEQQHYTEKIVYLNGCYQCTDNSRKIADLPLTRQQFGLPADAFVFCCFNQSAKLSPALFDVWMSVLADVPGSVLWLLEDYPRQAENLKREAVARGVDGERLVFSTRLPQAMHLARHRLADLALDTLPCNAHTTTSDALWAGLPVLTCTGKTFAGRVATSLLQTAGLPELVCDSLPAYRKKAIALATSDRGQLCELAMRLQQTRLLTPLFDTAAFTRQLESTFRSLSQMRTTAATA
jgi:predicted O-linked N-acetylglucosamine transferase (SPINDLY family)